MTITRSEAFQLLQIQQDATQDEIKSSYRKLALRYHPDKNKDDEACKKTFQRINAAYNLLSGDQGVTSLSDEQIESLFRDLIRTEWFAFLAQNFAFSDADDDSDFYDSDEECMNCEQWDEIEKKAQINAEKLVDEVEQEKRKLEKKRERRKKHKQRRKEKKREEKETSKISDQSSKDQYEIKEVSNIHIIKKDNHNSPKIVTNSPQKSIDTDSDSPEIDLGSAFCSKVKQKVEKSEARSRKVSEKTVNGDHNNNIKRSSPTQSASENLSNSKPIRVECNSNNINTNNTPVSQTKPPLPEPPTEENFFKSQEHARKGNEFAQFGKLHTAIEEYTKAINLNKIDHRCFGNRSYCYHSLKRYEDALSDANSAVVLVPNEPKGYFRKAKALCGLKKFNEAENALKKILELDPDCSEASHELFEVRLLQLQDFGFDRRACEHALIKSKNDIQGAIEFLLSSQFKDNMSFASNEVYDASPPPPPQMPRPPPPPIYPNIPQIQHSQMSTFFPLIPAGSYTASPVRLTAIAPGTRPHMMPAFQPMQVPYPQPRMQTIPMNDNGMMRCPPPTQHIRARPMMKQNHQHQFHHVRPNTMAVRPNNKTQHHMHTRNHNDKIQMNGNVRKFDPRDYSLWIGHFDSKKITEKDLYDVFAKYGKVSGVVIIKTHGKPLAYSFIHFMMHEDAKRAFNAAQNHVIQGISLDVNWNKNPTIECEHWLRGNCPYSNCHYLHVSDHTQYR